MRNLSIVKTILSVFKKDKQSVWEEFSIFNNGKFTIGKYGASNSVIINYRGYSIVFDSYTQYISGGGSTFEVEYTRVMLEYCSQDKFRFCIMNQGIIELISKLFGAQDVKIGMKEFDKKFILKTNDEVKLKNILSSEKIVQLLLLQNDVFIEVFEDECTFKEPIQKGNSLLYYLSKDLINEVNQLNDLLELYKNFIDELARFSSLSAGRR